MKDSIQFDLIITQLLKEFKRIIEGITYRCEDMFQFQDGIIDKSDGEEVKEFFQYFIIKEGYYRCKK